MRKFILPLGVFIAVFMPLVIGQLWANWLIKQLWPHAADSLFAWVLWLITAVILTLLSIAGWAIYKDKLWQGLMHPIAFIYSVFLVILALLSLPSLWGQLRLLAEGETAVGAVTRLSTGIDYDPETSISHTIYYLTYEFETKIGEIKSNKVEVIRSFYQQLSEGGALTISYLPDRSSYSLPTEAVQPQNRARRIFGFLLTVYVALAETAVVRFFWQRGLEAFLDRWD